MITRVSASLSAGPWMIMAGVSRSGGRPRRRIPAAGRPRRRFSAGVDLVIACGGDGTVTACAEGVAGTGVPLAIIPLGTGNLLARNVGVPMGLEEALEVALGGVQRPIDAGRVNGSLFVVMAGLGLDARMLDDTTEPLKKRLRWLAGGHEGGPD